MATYASFNGKITAIEDFYTNTPAERGCKKFVSVVNRDGAIINFIVTPDTYFVNHVMIQVGDMVIGFYDSSLPAPLIYPPQFTAVVMSLYTNEYSVTVDYFNRRLLNRNRSLQLNVDSDTLITLTNDQLFTGDIRNRNLIVIYDRTTKSIPAQTTPLQIIVLC